jgi:hypothetical protein
VHCYRSTRHFKSIVTPKIAWKNGHPIHRTKHFGDVRRRSSDSKSIMIEVKPIVIFAEQETAPTGLQADLEQSSSCITIPCREMKPLSKPIMSPDTRRKCLMIQARPSPASLTPPELPTANDFLW